MCIGLPMRVERAGEGWAECHGRGEVRRVRTAVVGRVDRGDWLLVFLDSAVQRIDAGRAAEIGEALDLLQAAIAGDPATPAAPAFALPSQIDAAALAALTGAAPPASINNSTRTGADS